MSMLLNILYANIAFYIFALVGFSVLRSKLFSAVHRVEPGFSELWRSHINAKYKEIYGRDSLYIQIKVLEYTCVFWLALNAIYIILWS